MEKIKQILKDPRPLPTNTKGATARDVYSGHPIESGDILTLKVKEEDLEKTKTVIETQWAVLKLAVICGAADVPYALSSVPQPPLPLTRVYFSKEDED